jgi:hypothetical protein
MIKSKIPVFLDFAERANRLKCDERVCFIRYEDLCLNPSLIVQKMCAFLGIKWESQMILFKTERGHTLTGNRMRFDDNQDIIEDLSWVTQLTSDEKFLFDSNKKLIDIYKELGYDITNRDGICKGSEF